MSIEYKKTDYYNQLSDAIAVLEDIIKKYKLNESVEIELRIGQFNQGSFCPGLRSEEFYLKVKNALESCKSFTKTLESYTEELVHNGFRRTMLFNTKKVQKNITIKKEKLLVKDFNYKGTPYDVRISVCTEKEVASHEKIKSGEGILRKKKRNSFFIDFFRFDLTKVITVDNTVETTTYEFEIEITRDFIDAHHTAHSALLKMRDIVNICEEITDESKMELIK